MSDEPRRWLELGVRCPTAGEREALLVDALLGLGGRAAEEREGWYLTHIEASGDLDSLRLRAEAVIEDLLGSEAFELRIVWREDEDWAETWKRGLGFRRITNRIAVRPSWIPEPAGAPGVVLLIDPGMAFGTAEHGTTRGCLRLLDQALGEGEEVLDVGAGSGVLAIAAALLGARRVTAFEADLLACEALRENVDRNGVSDRVRLVEGFADSAGLAAHGPADGVMANIESGTLSRLVEGFASALRPGGWLILSGILDAEWPALLGTVEAAGFRLLEVDIDGEWRAGLLEREGPTTGNGLRRRA